MVQLKTTDVTEAIEAADAAADSLASVPAERRAAALDAVADAVDALGDRLTEVAGRETHLPPARLEGERKRTVGQLRMFAALVREGSWVEARIDREQPDRQPMPKPDLRRMLVPIGPIAVFGASNFPLAFGVAGGDTASALAAGCPVVCKAHPGHPETSDLVGEAVSDATREAGLPAGTFAVVHTRRNEENLQIVRHPAIRGVGFTGSHRAGRALFDAANARPTPIPVFAEMGSVNPMVLLPGAVRQRGDAIAEGLHKSFTMGVGQFCTKPGVIFMLAGDATQSLIRGLVAHAEGSAPGPMLHDGIAQAYGEGLARLRATPGVETLAAVDQGTAGTGGAAVLRTTAARAAANAELLEECFGPATLVVVADDLDDLQRVLRQMPGQLTASIHAADDDHDAAARLLPALRRLAGRVLFNGFPTGVEVCPSMQHGGPYPATTDSRFTSVGTAAIARWARPVCYQSTPHDLLPPELQDANPRAIWRTVDGALTKDPL